ncbi:MAG: amino acid adenylation domain-containing protein, partial [Pseudomonadota bacterium]|nr:amino acid adenylation domain-containing protein [Pseudomonadota bacterium]
PALLELPADHPRPAAQRFRGAAEPLRLPPELTAALKALSQSAGATLFMTLLAAFAVLLSRYSGASDIVIGSPIANRPRRALEPLIGLFANTLALRVDLSGNPPFATLLERVRQTTLDGFAHQDLPLERLLDELQPQRSLSHAPLFQVMLALQNAPLEEMALPGLTLEPVELESASAKFDLTLTLHETPQGLEGVLEYNADLFDPATIRRLGRHLHVLLAGIVDDPRRPIRRLPLLTDAERQTLLHDWNATRVDYPPDRTVVDLFEAQAQKTPDAVAVEFNGQCLTYAGLNARANQLAHHLISLGVGPEVRAGLCLERSLELVAGVLGVLKAGGAYVPLDPAYPRQRLAYMVEDARPAVLLTHTALLERLPACQAQTLFLDRDWPRAASTADPPRRAGPDHLAYVIYTSGSTGRPKGTLLVHRGLSNYLRWALAAYPRDGSGAPVQSSLGFDATITSLYLPLLSGRTVALIAEGREIEGLGERLRAGAGFSLVKITPAHLDALNPLLGEGDWSGRARALVIGGEALLGRQVRPWRQRAPATRLINEYGPTETVVGCCVHEVEGYPAPEAAVPIGRPIANTRIYILDAAFNLAPLGVPGELYIGGAGLARGYFHRPALTAERFVPDPFEPGGRLYRTGDLARWRPDGILEYLGRIDDQVKIRGFRIELGEVEAALAAHPAVREGAVVVDGDGRHRRLAAFLVAKDAPVDAAELRRALRDRLPDYMIPAVFVWLEALPLTGNGKVDRRALAAQIPPPARLQAGTPPRTPREQVLAAIWKEVLGIGEVGIDDNFFELGGDSILGIQIVARARQAGLGLTPQQIFQHQTIAELAAAAADAAAAAEQGLITGPVPLTPIQRWLLEQDLAAPHHYNQAVFLEVAADLTPETVERAVAALLRHHDALRLRFPRTPLD